MIYIFLGENYTKYVREVLYRLRKYSLYIKLFKYKFFINTVDFLGYRVDIYDILIDSKRVKIIAE
jgi:hypothetical protein